MDSNQPEPMEELSLGSGPDDVLDLADLLNSVLDKGAAVYGDVLLAVADVDLVRLNLGLLLHGIATSDARQRSKGPESGPSADPQGPRSLSAGLGSIAPLAGKPAVSKGPTADVGEKQGASLNSVAQGLPERINADGPGVESGLARLVLTLIEVLRKVLEHQAVRRMEGGKLTEAEVERLGLALSRLNDRMQDLKRVFGLSDEDLQIDLGPLGRLR